MKEELGLGRYQALRARTLSNNLTWLASFGCRIDHQGEIIYIRHPELPEYNAYLVIGSRRETVARLESLLPSPMRPTPFIYVDEAFCTDAIRALLSENEFAPVLLSQIKVARFTLRTGINDVELKLAGLEDVEEWADLYAKGFGRSENVAQVDRARWQKSFSSREILHWFFVRRGRRVGVCQTSISSGVVGIYSFTVSRAARSMRTAIGATQSLCAEMVRRGEVIAYFERVRKRAPTFPATPMLPPSLKVIRRFAAYEKTGRALREE